MTMNYVFTWTEKFENFLKEKKKMSPLSIAYTTSDADLISVDIPYTPPLAKDDAVLALFEEFQVWKFMRECHERLHNERMEKEWKKLVASGKINKSI